MNDLDQKMIEARDRIREGKKNILSGCFSLLIAALIVFILLKIGACGQ